ncbi:MAG: phosphoglycerate dehydrogenase [Synergistaceae bacterium]|jgi:D-3-phosphoglycerate dehydrogenase|nr:phosphoglycerate dehydrogenase [Synergistaceae bacterium]
MFDILTLNHISRHGLEELSPSVFSVSDSTASPAGILVRSASMLDMTINDGLLVIARAGVGYNNIPVARCSEAGVVVFNTPGANANAVKELTLTGLLLSSRKIVESVKWAKTLKGASNVAALVEKGKTNFAGPELSGKTLGVVGLGAVGILVANACEVLGMAVIGYDPYVTVESAWALSRNVIRAVGLEELLRRSDYITVHIPLVDATRGLFNAATLAQMKENARLLNFSRGEIVDDAAVLHALKTGRLARYVTDFPSDELLDSEGVVTFPHLGASTPEAEDNCAVMAARQLKNYLENGNIKNSVNFPACDLGPVSGCRITVVNHNIPNVVGPITSVLAKAGMNIAHMLNKSKGNYAYNIIDVDNACSETTLSEIAEVNGVIKVRMIERKE